MAEARTDREQQTPRQSESSNTQRQLVPGQQQSLRRRSGIDYGANPFEFVRQLTEQMFGPVLPSAFRGMVREEVGWSPQIEVFERDGKLVVRADLPGMSKDDVHIEARDHTLILEGERRDERKENRDGVLVTERSYGKFYRIVPLPEGVNPEEAKACFKDGVLEVTMEAPKRQSAARSIPIEEKGEQGQKGEKGEKGEARHA
jgi:HSP20 family protein